MRASRSFLQTALGLVVVLFLAACGGTEGSQSSGSLTATARIAATVPVGAVVMLDGSGSVTVGGSVLTYSWVLTSKPAGSAATLDNPLAITPSFTTDVPGTYAVSLTVNDGTRAASVAASTIATAFTPPSIVADIVEPVSGSVQLSLSGDPGAATVTWLVDGTSIGTGATVTWDTTTFANGSHVVVARLQFAANYYVDVTRTFLVSQSTVSFVGSTVYQGSGLFTAITGAQSAYGIVRVAATIDGVPLGSLAVPNACLDPTGAACSAGPNAFAFGGSTQAGPHVFVITATDGLGNSLAIQLRVTVT